MLFKKHDNVMSAKWRLIGLGGKLLIDALFAKSKIRIQGLRPLEEIIASRQFIFAFWHSRILLPDYLYQGWNASIMVSNSADGEIIARIIERQGYSSVRGSTGKGGMRALLQLAADIRLNRRPAGVVPDGPQGPRHKAQAGVILLAKKSGYPIIPVTYSTKHHLQFNSWDRFMLPYPFSPCLMVYGTPLRVSPTADITMVQTYQTILENELNRITAEADGFFNHRFEP